MHAGYHPCEAPGEIRPHGAVDSRRGFSECYSMADHSTPEQAYFDRNQLALAFARLALAQGWTVGLGVDPDEPAWPVLYVDSPFGQVSWHLPKHEVDPAAWPVYAGRWDGHSVETKRERLARLIASLHFPA